MNSYLLNSSFNIEEIKKKQEIWRNKQFNIFYGSGRPIFDINIDTQHLRYHRNPSFLKDYNKHSSGRNYIPIQKNKKVL
jgi:hypothetical protein